MRPKLILTIILLAAGAAIAAGWMAGQVTNGRLQAERDALRKQRSELVRLQAERRRLRVALVEAMQRASLREAEAASARSSAPIEPPAVAPAAGLVPGEWSASDTWANRGRATATSTVETALWAAAHGEIPALVALLELDDVTRSNAADLLARLPPEARQAFGSPEEMIAIATLNAIPQTEAQVAWFNEADEDHAIVGLLLGNAEAGPATAAIRSPADDAGEPPPALSDRRQSKLTFLKLHRSASGWRLVVPVTAVDRLARKLSAPKD
jgi:hypothetical protein